MMMPRTSLFFLGVVMPLVFGSVAEEPNHSKSVQGVNQQAYPPVQNLRRHLGGSNKDSSSKDDSGSKDDSDSKDEGDSKDDSDSKDDGGGVCKSDDDCNDYQECCTTKYVCEDPPTDPTACGDPHMTGFRGQKFDFTGEDGEWYALLSSDDVQLNMRVTSPAPEVPQITYITGLSVSTVDAEGAEHSVVIETADPHSIESACPEGVSPCLADGSLSVVLDGQEALIGPGTVRLGEGVEVTAVNLPGACRSFGFEHYWERKVRERAALAGRRMQEQTMAEWILGDPTATNMVECAEYVAAAMAEDGHLFAHQSEHASFQIVTPTATFRLSHGRLHQIAVRDPTDQFDLPDHITWQMNIAIERNEVSRDARGILGETFEPTLDSEGHPVMKGMECIRGSQKDYHVAGPLDGEFTMNKKHN